MKIKLNRLEIINNFYTEEELLDLSRMESIYHIRKLKALSESLEMGYIDVDKINNHKQVFSKKYGIWFDKSEYLKI
jgi:hypothetical protein